MSILNATMKLVITFCLITGLLFQGHGQANERSKPALNRLTKAEKKAGWTLLFDGKTIDQWRGFRSDTLPGGWQIDDDAIARVGKAGSIVSKEQYQNFELSLEWKLSEGGNSGIFYHVSEDPKYTGVVATGPEMQLLDDDKHPDAKKGKDGNRRTGSLYDLIPASEPAAKPIGEYNQIRLICNNNQVEHWLNGKKIVTYQLGSSQWNELVKNSKFAALPDFGRIPSGHIALQDHNDKVWFRNIKIRRL